MFELSRWVVLHLLPWVLLVAGLGAAVFLWLVVVRLPPLPPTSY